MFAMVQHVGELGVRIHTVRNVETITNMWEHEGVWEKRRKGNDVSELPL
jgi:hypothetical protein